MAPSEVRVAFVRHASWLDAEVAVKLWGQAVKKQRQVTELEVLAAELLCLVPPLDRHGHPSGFVTNFHGESLNNMCLCVPSERRVIARQVIRDVGAQLIELHADNKVHMDVWPGNIVVQRSPLKAHLIDCESVTAVNSDASQLPMQLDFVPTAAGATSQQSAGQTLASVDTKIVTTPDFDWIKLGLVVRFIVDSKYRCSFDDPAQRQRQQRIIDEYVDCSQPDASILAALEQIADERQTP